MPNFFTKGRQMAEKLKKLWTKFVFMFPHALPVGEFAFIDYCDKLFITYDLPNLPSYHHAVATMIMNQSPTTDRLPPHLFAKSIRKAMANEVAYARLQSLRQAQKEAEKAAEAQIAQEATSGVVPEA